MIQTIRSVALAALLAGPALSALATPARADGAPRATSPPAPPEAPRPATPLPARPLDRAIQAAPRPTLGAARALRLAIVPVEFKDRKHDPRFTLEQIDALVYSRGTYTGKDPSGEPAFGSVADYFAEASAGRLSVEGKTLPWLQVRRERASYERDDAIGKALGFARFMTQALQALEARDGPKALDGYDALGFVIAGEHGKHGTVLWPHSAAIPWRGRLLKYYLMSETQGGKFAPIGVHCHELGHVLGILDKYGDGKHAGLGTWCLMAVGHRADRQFGDRRPAHVCAHCKASLGWMAPTTVDPRVEQTVRLRGVQGRDGEALKVLITPSGSEYFLLENRRKTGFDAGIARAGLLIWHVGEIGQSLRNKVWPYNIDLEEAHGDETRKGPFHDLEKVPWPIPGKDAFTPWSVPGSTSWSLASLPVYITGIREEGEDIVLTVGPPAKQADEAPGARVPAPGTRPAGAR